MVLWVGATHVLDGTLTVGDVLVFTSYLASLYAPINSLTQTWGLIQGAKVGAERVFEILETAARPARRRRARSRAARCAARSPSRTCDFGYDASRDGAERRQPSTRAPAS